MVAALLIANATLGTPELYAADYAPIFPEFSEVSNGAFYHETSEVDALPGEALQIFSKKLLEQTVDTPPEITAIISKHFWELL